MRHKYYNIALFFLLTLTANWVSGASLKIDVRDQQGAPLANAVVTFSSIDSENDTADTKPTVIDQINKEFIPEVTVVQAGTPISFPNNDRILHHVYSFSEAKTFDLPLYKGTPAEPVIFDKPGLVTLGCNIHDWMRAYVVVVDTPYYQITDEEGSLVITDIPVGDYQMEIWHPRQRKATIEQVYVGLEFNLNVEIATKPQFRSRRNSSGQSGNYSQ